jgi:hypothetical protein
MRDEARVYRQAVAQVLAVLTDVDPYGLEPGTPEGATADGFEGAPADEYELEAVDIARILLREGAVTVYDVEGVWMHWFSDSLVLHMGVARMAQLVDRLNELGSGAR